MNDAEKLAAVEANIEQVETDLTASQTTLQAEIDALKAGNPGLDFSKLEAGVAGLDTHAKAIGGLVPTA